MTDLPKMTPVKSSNIASVGHDGTALYVTFRPGKDGTSATYRYPTAKAEHHKAMVEASSPGQYFHQNIKDRHAGAKVTG